MADKADELAGQLGGMADPILRGHALFRGRGGAARGLRAFGFLFADAGSFQRDEQQRE